MAARKSRTFVPNAYTQPEVAASKIECTSTPSGASVTLYSEKMRHALDAGVTPVTVPLKEGIPYTVAFAKDGYNPVKVEGVILKAGEARAINVELPLPYAPVPPPEPTPAPAPAKLICDTTPSGAEVTLAATGISAYLGGTTPVTLALKPDVMYTLTFKKPGLKPTYKKYSLKPGEVRTINVTLPLPYVPVPPPPPPEPPIEPVPPPPEPPIEPVPPPPPEPPEEQKIDVITFTVSPSCVIGDICEGEMVLQNNTDAVLEGDIHINMAGAVPVTPVTYSIPAHSTETVAFEIPTEGLTILGTYVLELDMMLNEEVIETQSSKVDIQPPAEYEITITSEPSSAEVVVTEL